MHFANALDRVAAGLAWFGEAVAALCVVGMLVHIMTEMVLRSFFSTSTFVMDEFVGYMVAAMVFTALAGTLRSHQHLRVGLLVDRLPPAGRRVVEVALLVVLTAVAAFIAYYFWRSGIRMWRNGTVSQTVARVPLWIPLAVLFTGCVALALEAALQAIRTALGLVADAEIREGPSDA